MHLYAAAFFVSFWFWVGLGPIAGDDFNTNGGTIMAHAGNLAIALLQLLFTRLPIVSVHFQVWLGIHFAELVGLCTGVASGA